MRSAALEPACGGLHEMAQGGDTIQCLRRTQGRVHQIRTADLKNGGPRHLLRGKLRIPVIPAQAGTHVGWIPPARRGGNDGRGSIFRGAWRFGETKGASSPTSGVCASTVCASFRPNVEKMNTGAIGHQARPLAGDESAGCSGGGVRVESQSSS